jgi:hypothetical protein
VQKQLLKLKMNELKMNVVKGKVVELGWRAIEAERAITIHHK